MTWEDIANHLEPQWRRFDGSDLPELLTQLPNTDEDFARRAEKLELPSRERIDTVVRQSATASQWPELSSTDQYFVEKRLFYGWMLATNFAASEMQSKMTFVPKFRSKTTLPAALEWLLIDSWVPFGLLMWIHAETFRYYGIVGGTSRGQ